MLKELVFRQRPGAANALGHVKFLLDNPYSIYLHDTPADALFARPRRALSHGCVRLDQPQALAKYVLRDQPEWDDRRITEAMHSGDEKHVKLTQPLRVHIVYFTAWTDDAGAVQFLPDVYRYDAKQAGQLRTR
jgi:murein L,D-transpeptidase YcbB/YkuD